MVLSMISGLNGRLTATDSVPISDLRKTHRDDLHAISRMDFETNKVSCSLSCAPDLDDFHDHHVFIADQGFFHVQVGIADGPDPYKRVFLKGVGVERDKDSLAVINKGFAVGEEGEDGISFSIFGKQGQGIDNDYLRLALLDVGDEVGKDVDHLLFLPFEPDHVEGEDLEVAPGKIF